MKYTKIMHIVLIFGIVVSLVFASLPIIRYKNITKTYEIQNKNELTGTTEVIKKRKKRYCNGNFKY